MLRICLFAWIGAGVPFITCSQIKDVSSPYSYSIVLGGNVSKLKVDTLPDARNVFLPLGGINGTVRFWHNTYLCGGALYSFRGVNNTVSSIKYRNSYIDLPILLQYRSFNNVIILEGGMQYALLLQSKRTILTTASSTGSLTENTTGFTSQLEWLTGFQFNFTKGVDLGLRYTLPFKTNAYSNFQIFVNIRLADWDYTPTHRAYRSIKDASRNPTHVKKLVLYRQNLKTIPPEVFAFTELEHLVLDGNLLTTLPPEIKQLKKLKILSLRGNQLDSISSEIGQLSSLVELDLGFNHLKYLPSEIGLLQNLQYLYLNNNLIIELPDEMMQLSSLRELNIAYAGPGGLYLPEGIENLRLLEVLYIDQNTLVPTTYIRANPRLKIVIVR